MSKGVNFANKRNALITVLIAFLILGTFLSFGNYEFNIEIVPGGTQEQLPVQFESIGAPQDVTKDFLTSSGEGWLTGFRYRQQLNVYEGTGAGTNYPFKITAYYNTGSGPNQYVNLTNKAQADFDDVRFTDNDGSTELGYWRESYTASTSAIFWFKVTDDCSSESVTIYVYYGNSGVSTTSNGSNVFTFFEDFEDGTLDKWTTQTNVKIQTTYKRGNYGASHNVITSSSQLSVSGLGDSATSFIFDYWLGATNVLRGPIALVREADADHHGYERLGYESTTSKNYYYPVGGPYTAWPSSADNIVANTLYHLVETRTGTSWSQTRDGVSQGSLTVTQYTDINVVTVENQANYGFYIDDIILRKYVTDYPYTTTSNGEEVAVPVNGNVVCTNPTDTDNLYARYTTYTVSAGVTHKAGYEVIDTVLLYFVDSGGLSTWRLDYDVATTTFSEGGGDSYIELVTGSSTHSESGDSLSLVYAFKIEWAIGQRTDYDLKLYSLDEFTGSDTDTYDLNYDTETRLDDSSYSLTDGIGTATRGDYNVTGGITASGTIIYYGGTVHPPSTEVDVYVNCITGTATTHWNATNYESSGGTFSVTVDSDDAVGLDTYLLYVVLQGGAWNSSNKIYGGDPYVDYIADHITFIATVSETWVLLDVSITVTVSGTFDYDSSSVPNQVWSNADVGSVSYSTSGIRTWAINTFTNTHGLSFSNTSASCTWDDVVFASGPTYFWTQYSPDAVWLIWGTASTYVWDVNSSALQDGYKVESQINGTNNAWAVINGGAISGIAIGPFTSAWYYATITVRINIGGSYLIIWSNTLSVDILHSIHIESQTFYLADDYLTFGFQTNWNNATFYVWDNFTGTPVYIGGSYEGWYQIPKSTTVGLHKLIVLVNGTQGTISVTSQVATGSSTDSWEYFSFWYTVNPVVLSISELTVYQNNVSIIVGGFISTPSLTLTWSVTENGILVDNGTFTIAASGDYYVLHWTKNYPTTLVNFTLTITAGASSLQIHGYSIPLDTLTYTLIYSSGSYEDGDTLNTYYVEDSSIDAQFVLNITALVFGAIFLGGIVMWRENRKRKDTDFRLAVAGGR